MHSIIFITMKFTHNAVTSIMVEKVENITTSMTRAGLGDDTYRRQREKQRYNKYKQEQAEKQDRMREDFLKKRNEKIHEAEQLTEKRHAKRQKKKERQRQLKKKMKFIQKLDKIGNPQADSDSEDNEDDPEASQSRNLQVHKEDIAEKKELVNQNQNIAQSQEKQAQIDLENKRDQENAKQNEQQKYNEVQHE